MSEGVFVVFSGGEGSGKTTILRKLKEEFPHLVTTREPGGTPFGEALRGPLLNSEFSPSVWAELFLFMSIRAQHVRDVIIPNRAAGRVIISDRYMQDSYAHQWYTKIGEHWPAQLFQLAEKAGFPNPDVWLWFDVDPAVGLARRHATEEVNRIDREALEYHTSVRAAYEYLMRFSPYTQIGHRIDANQSIEEVYASVKAALETFLQP